MHAASSHNHFDNNYSEQIYYFITKNCKHLWSFHCNLFYKYWIKPHQSFQSLIPKVEGIKWSFGGCLASFEIKGTLKHIYWRTFYNHILKNVLQPQPQLSVKTYLKPPLNQKKIIFFYNLQGLIAISLNSYHSFNSFIKSEWHVV